ncbi:MAG: phosphoribosylformylglycinamidine synthase subunit PurL [Bryobacterales bacterium]|nr:phosphoribosylformylglycinamidine synthase subunit PurL [Bryobacterales bacterium]
MSTITPETVAAHNLKPDEYERIVTRLGREPNITELGIFSVMWSEHCSYKSSRIHLKKLPTKGKYVLHGPGENAGVIDIGGDWAIAFKIESHNHPSFIEPFQGAATGVGGILRDIFTMGARPIAALNSLRFGTLNHPEDGARNRRILEGVVAGIAHYGNCFGVPTVGGECVFEDAYSGNPLVNVFALGVVRKDQIFLASAHGVGNPVIYVGAKTGRDGIQGAAMASAEFDEDSMDKRPNVQVGDPFMEKLLFEACLEALATGAVVAMQDMGAAGLTCSTCEMGSKGHLGIEIDLMHVPQREEGMTPYEIMLSESQERMLLVAEKGREQEVLDVFHKWGLDARIVGVVTEGSQMVVRNHGEIAADLPNRFLADEAPVYDRPHEAAPYREAPMEAPAFASAGLTGDLLTLCGAHDLASKRWIYEQFDFQVRTNTVLGPGADAAIVRIKEAGKSVAMSLDGNGRYCYLDPKLGAKLAVAESCRNLSTVGALPVAATNNLNFGNPERPEIMAQLVEAIEGIAEACAFFETPITGGNVSLYNETLGVPIYPTPVLGVVGVMDTQVPVAMGFPAAGLEIGLIGGIGEADEVRFGSTQYAKQVLGQLWGLPPALDMDFEKRVQATVREAVASKLVASAHDVSDGGLAFALAECAIPSSIGANIELDSDLRPELLLFHEGPSRVIVSAADLSAVEEIASAHGVPLVRIGRTAGGTLTISNRGDELVRASCQELAKPWEEALPQALGQVTHV